VGDLWMLSLTTLPWYQFNNHKAHFASKYFSWGDSAKSKLLFSPALSSTALGVLSNFLTHRTSHCAVHDALLQVSNS